ncbi:DegQ family serine endoprotease [Mariniblastus fucicola]|uniref:Putative periplasmic serine endoprotease DegP-like n=1 Tax=Mariniblastus fucicola TaxID=980251 RepID=A0A5B9PQU1_9BACT|nr:DegQ family serine endoprotease [Mariniblastus fucicola]QEG24683.1 putative periplasmic serine endoprotease DegP-like precursor [Mariniblastus fucicola]
MKQFDIRIALLLLATLSAGGFIYPKYASTAAYSQLSQESDEAFEQLQTARNLSDAFKHVAKALRPSVVSISTESKPQNVSVRGFKVPAIPFGISPFFGDDIFRDFQSFEIPRTIPGKQGLGSGIIVESSGHILTNHHVIKGAEKISVTLSDDRSYDAKVIGSDPETDLAVLKIDASGLQAVKWADSDAAEVGEWVVAVGSPFGLNQTVTSGIISALGRDDMGITNYENFIQTDAAINPGNSGGPLVNLKGELLGINTAIASRNGAFNGIGFAIPSSMANQVMTSIMDSGKVSRGYLGVMIQDLNDDLAASFNFEGDGVLIGDVAPDGPADKGGLLAGDIVTRLNGEPAMNSNGLRNRVASIDPESTVDLEIVRNGKVLNLQVQLGVRDQAQLASWQSSGADSGSKVGLSVEVPTPELRDRLDITVSGGVVVTRVDSDSMSARAGIQQGDLILSINGNAIESMSDFSTAINESDVSEGIRLRIHRNGATQFVFMKSS